MMSGLPSGKTSRTTAPSPREAELIDLLKRGHCMKSAAREMGISPCTARRHKSNLATKLGLETERTYAILNALGAFNEEDVA